MAEPTSKDQLERALDAEARRLFSELETHGEAGHHLTAWRDGRAQATARFGWASPIGRLEVLSGLSDLVAASGADAVTFVSDVTFLVLEAGESATGVRPSLDPRAGNALVGVALSGGRVVARGAVAYGVGDDGQITPQPWPHQLDVGATLGGEIVDRLMQALDQARLRPAGDAEHLREALGRLARWRALVEIDATLEARLFAGPTTGLTAL